MTNDAPPFSEQLDAAKAGNLAHLLVRCARLLNEQGLSRVRELDAFPEVRASHLAMMPHLDLEGTRATELARRMDITKQAVGQLVAELEQAGIVERVPDPTDGRARLVRFTDAGRAALLEGLGVLAGIDREVRAALGDGTMARLLTDLSALHAWLVDRAEP